MGARTFCFCLEVCEDESLWPIYGDYLEDAGLPRSEAIPCNVTTSLEIWVSSYWRNAWLNPIMYVTLNDRRPYNLTWASWTLPGCHDYSELPAVLLRYMYGKHNWYRNGKCLTSFYTNDEATAALSQALIAWARDKVRQELGEHIVC